MKEFGKTLAKKIMSYTGFELKRRQIDIPSEIDTSGNYWKKWIAQAPLEFAEIYLGNREIQRSITNWMSEETYNSSLWEYGLPRGPEELLRIENSIAYTDLIIFLSRFLNKVNYLEIGVSAGKNFIQACKQLKNASLYGFDIEEINPVIESVLSQREVVWNSEKPHKFKARKRYVDKTYSCKKYLCADSGNEVFYLSGDKFRDDIWRQLQGTRFSFIFSDACHIPLSIETELEFLIKYDLINTNEFIMVWDDVSSVLLPSVLKSMSKLFEIFNKTRPYAALYDIHGTYGSNKKDGVHKVGLFCYRDDLTIKKNPH